MATTVWRADHVFNKKVLLGALLAVAGYLGYRRYQSGQAEQDLWAEATDPIPPADPCPQTRTFRT
ncbi:DLW-39 family protein [Haloactinopolyspora alba]|uniref:DLW-39 family protein n=1 Tax=Haloactinopolyspora alba TaxID=648780 RepID=UPI000D0D6272|nr:DLW-39 family protein [Haloactinopolyspora alba]